MIKIAVVSYNNETPISPVAASFSETPQTIGRSDDNFLVLPDPKHFVSRTQAKVWSDGTHHYLMNVSLANPVSVNGKEIDPEHDYAIHIGDQIQIGLYVLEVLASEAQSDTTFTAVGGTDVIAAPAPTESVSFVKTAALQGDRKETPQPPRFLMRADTDAVAENLHQDEVHSLPPATTMQPASDGVVAEAVEVADVAKLAESAKAVADSNDLLNAFLQGAGLTSLHISSGLTTELMETLGKLVATSVEGTMGLISQRALVKREVNADVTMVVLRKNNPLKFFPDSQTVLTQMLRKKMPGFMTPAEAMEDAFQDLRAHQLGVVAGMKAAMDALQKKFEPAGFARLLPVPTLMDKMNPARRKADMWDHFVEMFEDLSLESKDEFQTLFGKEFLAAYEREVERARHESPAL